MQIVSTLPLDDTRELLFFAHTFRKRRLGAVRIFVDSPKYAGPTKAGVDMTLEELTALRKILAPVADDLDSGSLIPPLELGRVPTDTPSTEWVVQVLVDEKKPELFRVDVRKYVNSERFTGWTKKGIRLDVDLLDDLVPQLEKLIESLENWKAGKTGMFAQPEPTQDTGERQPDDKPPDLGSVPEDLREFF